MSSQTSDQTCATKGCGKAASMRCPSCLKLDVLDGSFFCSQECFKGNWTTHKPIHKHAKTAKALSEGPMTWPGFNFTGALRPYRQSKTRVVPKHIPRPDYAETGEPLSEMKKGRSHDIDVLNVEQQALMRDVCRLGREVLDEAAKVIKVGVTCDEIDRVVHEASVARDCYPSPLNYQEFPKSCCTSVNEVICHGIPDGYKLQDGDIVNVDVTVFKHGYHGDLNETFLVGNVSDHHVQLVKCAYDSLMEAISQVKPGMKYRDIGNIVTKVTKSRGFSVVRSYCGHGINTLFHTSPSVPHYAKNKAVGIAKPGHCFTIEPMINEGHFDDTQWPDNWTAVTCDGKWSAQFEHTMMVTETGVEVLTARLPDSPNGPAWFENHPSLNKDDTTETVDH